MNLFLVAQHNEIENDWCLSHHLTQVSAEKWIINMKAKVEEKDQDKFKYYMKEIELKEDE